jgi:hypothetical protein
MFDNNTNLYIINYEVQLDSIVKAICDISFDIGKQIEEILQVKNPEAGFTIEDLFIENFLKEVSVRPDKLSNQDNGEGDIVKGFTNDEFFAFISGYYNQSLPYIDDFLSGCENSDIILINKKQSYFIGKGERAKERLIPALKAAKILKNLVSNIASDKIRNSLEKINLFENDIFYKNTIIAIKQVSQPLLPVLSVDFLDMQLVDFEQTDKDDYWINFQFYNSLGYDFTEVEEYIIVCDKEYKKEIGLLVNDVLLPFANLNLNNFILTEKLHNYYWLLLKETYSHKKQLPEVTNPEIEEFKDQRNDVELNHLLSFLKNNFYLSDGALIKAKFNNFFNSVVFLDKLDFLSDYQFLMSSNIEEETALGIYSTVKKESSYNLLHWLNHNGLEKINHYRSTSPIEKSKKLIYTLKPAICYYFLEKYFEDFFENILHKNAYDYFANHIFNDRGQIFCEVDFFINTGNKFYYVETKTKLSKFYIDDFLKKSSKMMDKFRDMYDKGLTIEFILLTGYSDNNVKDYQYFIDESSTMKDKGYNSKREGLNSIPYFFQVPIPDKEGSKILCIAEPEYDKLQNIVLQICQK